MTRPDDRSDRAALAAQMDQRWVDWAVLYGSASDEFVAFLVGPFMPAEYTGPIVTTCPDRLEEGMARIQSAVWRAQDNGYRRPPVPLANQDHRASSWSLDLCLDARWLWKNCRGGGAGGGAPCPGGWGGSPKGSVPSVSEGPGCWGGVREVVRWALGGVDSLAG